MQTTASPEVRTEPNVTPMIDVMLVLLIIFGRSRSERHPRRGDDHRAPPADAGADTVM